MTTQTNKAFDCVAMKCDIQQRLLDEYNASGDSYDSYWSFLRETNRLDPNIQNLKAKLGFSNQPNDC